MSWRHRFLCLSLLALPFVAGCDKGSSSSGSGRVAVIDLKQVSDQLGRTASLQQTLASSQQQLDAKLRQLQEQIQKKIDAKAASLGPVPDPKAVQELEGLKAGARQYFEDQVRAMQGQINHIQVEFSTKLREDVKAVALRQAQKRGRSVVVMKEAVIDYDAEADITDAVIQEMKSVGRALPSAPPGLAPAPTSPDGTIPPATTAPSSQPDNSSPFNMTPR